MREVLVSGPGGVGVVGLGDGSLVVTEDVLKACGGCVQGPGRFDPVKAPVDVGRCVVGGWLFPGSVSAEVVDDRGARVAATVGGGAYVAVLEQPDDGSAPIVCCRDAAGEPVRRPRTAGDLSTPVLDARQSCPACGATDFGEYQPVEPWRGGEVLSDKSTRPARVVCCQICGHEEKEAFIVTAPARPADSKSKLSPAEMLARARSLRREHMWLAVAPALETQSFPIYVADGWPARLSGCSTEDDGRLTEVTADHYDTIDADPSTGASPRLSITTKLDDPRDSGPLGEARFALRGWARRKSPMLRRPGGSDAARTLQRSADSRDANAIALDADRSECALTLDGAITTALRLTVEDGWVAVAVRDTLTVIVRALNAEPGSLRLSPVADPASEFGPQTHDA